MVRKFLPVAIGLVPGYGLNGQAVKDHPFGFDFFANRTSALIAFLRTL